MRVEVIADSMGYDVRLSSADRRDFGHLLNLFKSAIPENCRRFNAGVWRVEKRAQKALATFIAMAEDAGAKVVQATQRREVKTMEQMANAVRGARRAA